MQGPYKRSGDPKRRLSRYAWRIIEAAIASVSACGVCLLRLRRPVHLWDERLSTQEALRHAGGGEDRRTGRRSRGRQTPQADTDAIAASIILQAYLDSLRFGSPDRL